jgi:hypothetical protein
MQACPRCAAGTRASTAAGISTVVHQQGLSNVPDTAGAQPFGPPHSGQWQAGRGRAGVM